MSAESDSTRVWKIYCELDFIDLGMYRRTSTTLKMQKELDPPPVSQASAATPQP